jgi:SAM-dependent methyltransferase
MSEKSTTVSSLAEEIAGLAPWFHNLHLPDGTQTAPDHFLGDFPSFKWEQIRDALPADLSGWTALDIGCNAGYYTFELIRRGARVTGIDYDAHYLRQARWAAQQFGVEDRVELRRMQVYDLARVRERWDLVLFMGVLYRAIPCSGWISWPAGCAGRWSSRHSPCPARRSMRPLPISPLTSAIPCSIPAGRKPRSSSIAWR